MEKKRGRRRIIIILIAIIILAFIVFFNLRSQREKAIKVTVEEVKKHDLTSIISASGEVKPKKNVDLSAQARGKIEKINVEEGEEVKEGDFLLKIESTQYEANAERDRALLRSYQAELIKAQASLNQDKRFYERQERLFEEELISREELEAAKAKFEISQAHRKAILFQIEQAKASLQSTMDRLSKTTYNSPIDGIVTGLWVEEGEVAFEGSVTFPGTVMMTIADLSVMEVEVEVDETDVVGVQIGQMVDVRVDALPEQVIQGKVTEIGSSAIQKTTSAEESKDFRVVVTLKDPPKKLKPGLSASADIITDEKKDVLAVPISALVLREKDVEEERKKREEEEGVYVISAENRVKFQPVKKGIMGEMMIEITEGLKEGQKIVVGPYNALRQLKDDTPIKPEEKKSE